MPSVPEVLSSVILSQYRKVARRVFGNPEGVELRAVKARRLDFFLVFLLFLGGMIYEVVDFFYKKKIINSKLLNCHLAEHINCHIYYN